MTDLSIALGLIYATLLFTYLRAWKALSEFLLPMGFKPGRSVTVLIPARNEAENIGACLRSILEGSYPQNLLEIIVLDDFSNDELSESCKLSESLISIIRLADHLPPETRNIPNKKKAIELGVARAKNEIIVTTDADCLVPKDWLRHIAAAMEHPQTRVVCGPVAFQKGKNLLQRFQLLDFMGMMGITGAGYQLGWHTMANGANLAFRKPVFEAVGAYSGNEHLASGDDMFLVQKVADRWPGSVVFLKNTAATVQTEAAPDWRTFWHQRLRWGTKNAAIPSWPLRLSLLAVFLFCWSIWLNLVLAAFCRFNCSYAWVLIFQILVKGAADYAFLSEMCRFFKQNKWLQWFWSSFFLHTLYIAFIGTASIFTKKYEWKGRKST